MGVALRTFMRSVNRHGRVLGEFILGVLFTISGIDFTGFYLCRAGHGVSGS